MKNLVKFIIVQEIYYSLFLVAIGLAIGFQNGFYAGLRVFLYALLLIQPVILWINRKVIKDLLQSKYKFDE